MILWRFFRPGQDFLGSLRPLCLISDFLLVYECRTEGKLSIPRPVIVWGLSGASAAAKELSHTYDLLGILPRYHS
jgi:hypothetical protein